jgi:hyperosmotically inducible periplasmic protein
MRRRPSSTDAITVAAVILMAVLSGCRTTQAIDPIAIQDAQLAAQVKSALINDPEVGTSPIEVSVVRGVARLTGTVATPAIAQRAVTLARSVQGVRDVQPSLQVGVTTVKPAADTAAPRQSTAIPEAFETEENPGFLAVGASLGWSRPRVNALGEHVSVSPLVRFGSGRGFGPAIAFNWFRTSLAGEPRRQDVISDIYVRPIMIGLGYTFRSNRISVSPSLVAGVAFNSVSVPDTGAADRIAVEVNDSLVWRPGVSVWFDVNRHIALNMTVGHVVTGLRVTFLEDGRLVKQSVSGDTTTVHAGIAYKLF